MGRQGVRLAQLAIVLGCAAAWELTARFGVANPMLLPPLSTVVAVLADMLGHPAVHRDLAATLFVAAVAFAISVPLGALVGLLVAENKYWEETLKPLLFFPLSIPKSVFLPLFILAFGIGMGQKIVFGVFSTVFIVIMSTMTAIHSVNPDHVRVARAYGARPGQIIGRVYIPSMLPVLLEGLRLALIFNFTGVILAEMYAARAGMGHLIATSGENYAMSEMLAGVLLVGAIAIGFNEALRYLEARCSHWRT